MEIGIIDYGMGNLCSVQKAFESISAQVEIIHTPEQIQAAERIVLPGVGAFEDAISEIKRLNLVDSIVHSVESGKPFLGICLGLQMLFDTSYENGVFAGLGLIPGEVVKFNLPKSFTVPHMGWNQVRFANNAQADCPLLKGIEPDSYFYFVHSYYVCPKRSSDVVLTCNYGGDFCAMIQHENLFACQFHPEKSQLNGLKILKNFYEMR